MKLITGLEKLQVTEAGGEEKEDVKYAYRYVKDELSLHSLKTFFRLLTFYRKI